MTEDDKFIEAARALDSYASVLKTFQVNWRHLKTGGLYSIVGLALEEATLTPVVVYESISGGPMWTRPAAEFLDRFSAT